MYIGVRKFINPAELSRNIECVSKQWRKISTKVEECNHETEGQKEFLTIQAAMKCWHLKTYGGIKELHMKTNAPVPTINSPYDILVEVCASSVNPLDVYMCDGYGSTLFGTFKIFDQGTLSPTIFPLTLGRDFSGIVRDTGRAVNDFSPGDEVVGVIRPHSNIGAHAEYTVGSSSMMAKKPTNLSHVEAASLTYAGLTAWCALRYFGGINPRAARGKRALVLGGSGGVGTIAIQLMKSWGMRVTTVVNSDAVPLVTSLGADHTIDYKDSEWERSLKALRGYDLVFNCTANSSPSTGLTAMKEWHNAKFVSVTSPLLKNINAFGLPLGVLSSLIELGFDNLKVLPRGQTYRWAYALPCKSGLEQIMLMASIGSVLPVIEKVFSFQQVPEAFEKVKAGHARGKTVINMKQSTVSSSNSTESESFVQVPA